MGEDTISASGSGAKLGSTDAAPWRPTALAVVGFGTLIWAVFVAVYIFAFTADPYRAVAVANLAHLPQILTHLPQHAVLLLATLATLVAGIAPGDALLRAFRISARDAFDRIGFATAAGIAVLTGIAYALAAAQLLRVAVEVPILAAGVVLSAMSVRRWLREMPRVPDSVRVPRAVTVLLWLALAAALYINLLAALTPENGHDGRWYHLTEAERYAQHGGFYNLVAAERLLPYALPHYEETLYAFQWVLFGAIGSKMMAWGGAVGTVLALVAFSRVWFSCTAVGVLASAILFTTPVLAWSTTTANNDIAAIPFVVLAFHAILTWQLSGASPPLYAAGLFAGMTYGIKQFGAFTVLALGIVAAGLLIARRVRRKRVAAELAAFAAWSLLGLVPALISAAWMVGNPFYPLFTGIIPTQYGGGMVGTQTSAFIASHLVEHLSPSYLLSLPWSMTMDPVGHRDAIGPVWLAMLPLCVASLFFKVSHAHIIRPLVAFVSIFSAIVLLSGAVEARYIASALALAALLIAYCVFCLDWRAARPVQTALIASLIAFTLADNPLLFSLQRDAFGPGVMGSLNLTWPFVYEGLPDRNIQLKYAVTLEYANAHLVAGRDKIYDATKLQYFNVYSEIALFNGSLPDGPAAFNEWTLVSPDAYERLREAGCTYVVVYKSYVPTLRASKLWKHLQFVMEDASTDGPTVPEVLYKIHE